MLFFISFFSRFLIFSMHSRPRYTVSGRQNTLNWSKLSSNSEKMLCTVIRRTSIAFNDGSGTKNFHNMSILSKEHILKTNGFHSCSVFGFAIYTDTLETKNRSKIGRFPFGTPSEETISERFFVRT